MLQAQHWERPLLELAHAALESDVTAGADDYDNQKILQQAYARCEEITRENSKTFYLASSLMPAGKRQATRALYAFCRISDDLIDRPDITCLEGSHPQSARTQCARTQCVDSSGTALDTWRKVIRQGNQGPVGAQSTGQVVSLAWADARRRFCIPFGYVDQLLDGLSSDLKRVRYATFADLAGYCYGVACTVGLMSMHITGYAGREAIPYAIRLGVALQLTNILRDVGEDWRSGRLYLPLEELAEYGLDETDIAAGRVDDRWRAFMRFQIARARRLYADALPGVSLLHPDGRFAIAAAGELYQAILDQIERNDYDVFRRRAATSVWGKLRRLPGIWWRASHPSVA